MWMHTGDEASMDADGYVRITGRIKDLIIKGGENIHPLEVENCLFAHPAVREVSVVGIPDERYGEVVAAFVVKHEGQEGIVTADGVRSWVREGLSHHLGKSSCNCIGHAWNDSLLTSVSAEICLLCSRLSKNSKWQNSEVQAERVWHKVVAGREGIVTV
jgi:acyl-CoA synthetase (AMP-forming)/AMP-acid ligase II